MGILPAPTIIGPTATYASVLPGVDLQLTATSDGVTEALVVHSAQAAANPELASLTFPVSASGLTLSADGSGGAAARDADGNVLFDVPPPELWDSTGAGSNSRAPGAGAKVAPMPMAVISTGLTVSPSNSLLTAPSTVYPVHIDPEVTVHGPGTWLDVGRDNNGGSWGDWEPSDARVGASCQDDGSGNCINSTRFEYRSFFNFPVPHQIWGAQQVGATLFTTETWSWTCSAKTTRRLQLRPLPGTCFSATAASAAACRAALSSASGSSATPPSVTPVGWCSGSSAARTPAVGGFHAGHVPTGLSEVATPPAPSSSCAVIRRRSSFCPHRRAWRCRTVRPLRRVREQLVQRLPDLRRRSRAVFS